jgi:uncharacterized protein
MIKTTCSILLCCAISQAQITLIPRGSAIAGGEAAAEIGAFDPKTRRLFSTNAAQKRVDVLEISKSGALTPLFSIAVGGTPNSVAIQKDLVAVAVENSPKTAPGFVKFYDTNGTFLSQVTAGALPDMLTFSPDGRWLLIANEGEPNSYNQPDSVDPEGSVTIIDMTDGVKSLGPGRVRTATFSGSIPLINASSIRVYGPNAKPAQDFEPEYIAVSDDSETAWVVLQENNAIAVLDIETARFTRISGLGTKDHRLAANKLDPSDRDGGIRIANWPVHAFYLPDAIHTFRDRGNTYLVMANEGDTRDWPGFNEEARVGALTLDSAAFPNAATLIDNANLGRLTVTRAQGDVGQDGDYEQLFVPGGRSFSIRKTDASLVWDSGSQFEDITADRTPATFNSNGGADTFDTRSDNKGPEPEGLTIGKVSGRLYAFIGLERTGGIMVYDISEPDSPGFVTYVNTTPEHISPEGLLFVDAGDSPTGKPLLVVNYEISGTIQVLEVAKTHK